MRARVVDWLLLGLTVLGVLTGLWSFFMGDPQGRWLFVAHGILGLAIVGVLIAKVRRVTPIIVVRKGRRLSALVGIATAIAALVTVGFGVWWVVTLRPTTYPNGMILHTTAGFVLLGLCLWHLLLRFRPLSVRDVGDRRSTLRLLAILLGSGVVWSGMEGMQRLIGTDGSRRRFTGSRREAGTLPVTMWMFDNPQPLDLSQYGLTVGGGVVQPLRMSHAEVLQLPRQSLVATLDCTGGWYGEKVWHGIRVGDLLAQAQVVETARFVRFQSVTGYRWSLPLEEAADTLLATHLEDEPLSHGHGAPLRLVAPGRRGFQWVKWVVALDVLSAPDAGQWRAIFTSGLDGA